jgi:AraC-like DNA-binding protein
MVVCGSSPMGYFKKRRLTGARLALLRGDPETDLVKCAALGAGLTHMGRFSAEYHQLFGELPTATLNQTQH